MMIARQRGSMGLFHDITIDGVPFTTLRTRTEDSNSAFDLAGRYYEVRTSFLSRRYDLVSDGRVLAHAEGVGRKRWTVAHDRGVHTVVRGSWGSSGWLKLLDGDRQVGHVQRTSLSRLDAEAVVPGAPPTQVFTIAVVLSTWRIQTAAVVMMI